MERQRGGIVAQQCRRTGSLTREQRIGRAACRVLRVTDRRTLPEPHGRSRIIVLQQRPARPPDVSA